MTTPRTPRRSASRSPHGVGRVLAVVGLPLALASMMSLAQCDSDGVTPVCPAEGGGDCVTPPGTSSASVVITTGGAAGAATGSGGSGTAAAGSGGSADTSAAGSAGSGGATTDGGLLSVLDAALDIQLGQ